MNLLSPLEIHFNMNLSSSSFEVHFNMNLSFPLLKRISLKIYSNMDPPSLMLQHTPPAVHSNMDFSSSSRSLKHEFNENIKSRLRQIRPNASLSFIPSSSNSLSFSSVNVFHIID